MSGGRVAALAVAAAAQAAAASAAPSSSAQSSVALSSAAPAPSAGSKPPRKAASAEALSGGAGKVLLTITRTTTPGALVDLSIARTAAHELSISQPGTDGALVDVHIRGGSSRTAAAAKSGISNQVEKPPKAAQSGKADKVDKAPKQPVTVALPKPPSAAGVVVAKVPLSEPARLDATEIAACQVAQESDEGSARVAEACRLAGLESAHFWRVRADYYEQDLPWRRDVLGASSVQQLCKSMIMENTKLSEEEAAASGRLKYVCFVVQYAGAKLQKEKMHDAVRALEGPNAVGKKQYSVRMVSQEVSDRLSGFEHNAVTPVGMRTPVPVLLSHKLKAIPEGRLWMGGGHPDVKLRLDVAELVTKLQSAGHFPSFADLTEAD